MLAALIAAAAACLPVSVAVAGPLEDIQELLLGDTTPPQTTIDSSPANPTGQTNAEFQFSSSEAGSTFECRLDSTAEAGFVPCSSSSPRAYTGLNLGQHTFDVRATDDADNVDPTPASFTWTIRESDPPETSITSGPDDPTRQTSASFVFDADEAGSSFECRLDSAVESAFAPCISPHGYTGLAVGQHTFDVRAIDASDNVDPTPASHTWTVVEPGPPETSIESGPDDPTRETSASFLFEADADGSTFECRLDSSEEGFTACASGQAYTGLSEGGHLLEVRATDPVGNVDPTPASYTWNIDLTGPAVAITERPVHGTHSHRSQFEFNSAEAGASFECWLRPHDSTEEPQFEPCSSPQSYELEFGRYTFAVRALDSLGNLGATAEHTWSIVGRGGPTPAPPRPVCTTRVIGTIGVDILLGSRLSERIDGRGSDDVIRGRDGKDCLFGGPGRDRISGGPGSDAISGGPGNDVISARDGTRDTIVCGRGRDTVAADRRDRTSAGCDVVNVR